jgi:hypothetical protein
LKGITIRPAVVQRFIAILRNIGHKLAAARHDVRPVATAPTHDPEHTLLLYCPQDGGWHTGVFFEGRWLDSATLTRELHPTHFTDVPPEPEGES